MVEKSDPALPKGFDRVVVQDAQAPPLWARFYEIGANRPIFCGRDGVIKYSWPKSNTSDALDTVGIGIARQSY